MFFAIKKLLFAIFQILCSCIIVNLECAIPKGNQLLLFLIFQYFQCLKLCLESIKSIKSCQKPKFLFFTTVGIIILVWQLWENLGPFSFQFFDHIRNRVFIFGVAHSWFGILKDFFKIEILWKIANKTVFVYKTLAFTNFSEKIKLKFYFRTILQRKENTYGWIRTFVSEV